MDYHAFIIKYAEIGVKGSNRYIFEDMLVQQIKYSLKQCDGRFIVRKTDGRIYAEAQEEFDFDEAVSRLKCVCGVSGFCPMVEVDRVDFSVLKEVVVKFFGEAYPDRNKTFKVEARRARKSYPVESMEMNAELGGALLDAYPELKVDVHHPEIMVHVEVRDKIYIYSEVIPGPGGLPVGTGGKAMLLLSGGIDSPVAGYMVAKRGVKLDAVYFNAPPYTSERAKQKVIDLAAKVARYSGPVYLHIVNFTDIQLYIYDKCEHDELTIIMRRYMMRIAEALAKQNECLALVTGESIGQVASQTTQSLLVTNAVCTLPVFRPLIAFDKMDIVRLSEQIDTYETSIQPYEDCCTIFVAKHPVTKPRLDVIEKHEHNLDEKIDELVKTAIDTNELMVIRGWE